MQSIELKAEDGKRLAEEEITKTVKKWNDGGFKLVDRTNHMEHSSPNPGPNDGKLVGVQLVFEPMSDEEKVRYELSELYAQQEHAEKELARRGFLRPMRMVMLLGGLALLGYGIMTGLRLESAGASELPPSIVVTNALGLVFAGYGGWKLFKAPSEGELDRIRIRVTELERWLEQYDTYVESAS